MVPLFECSLFRSPLYYFSYFFNVINFLHQCQINNIFLPFLSFFLSSGFRMRLVQMTKNKITKNLSNLTKIKRTVNLNETVNLKLTLILVKLNRLRFTVLANWFLRFTAPQLFRSFHNRSRSSYKGQIWSSFLSSFFGHLNSPLLNHFETFYTK